MAVLDGFGMPGFDARLWCARLAGTIDALLDPESNHESQVVIAREVMREYDEAIARAAAARDRADSVVPIDNVFPIRRPHEVIALAIDQLFTPTKGGQ